MSENKTSGAEFGAIAASLGMQDREMKDVMARISELVAVEGKLAETNKALKDAQTVIAGRDATIGNLQKELTTATNRLGVYEAKEAEQTKARIEALVENAIAEGKIDRESKAQWVEMARATSPWRKAHSVRSRPASRSQRRSPRTPPTYRLLPKPPRPRSN